MRELLGDAAAPGDAGDIDFVIAELAHEPGGPTRDSRRTIRQFRQRRAAHAGDVEDDRLDIAHLAHERFSQFDIGADAVEQKKRRTVLSAGLHGDPKILSVDAHHASAHRAAAASDRLVALMETLSLRAFAVTH